MYLLEEVFFLHSHMGDNTSSKTRNIRNNLKESKNIASFSLAVMTSTGRVGLSTMYHPRQFIRLGWRHLKWCPHFLPFPFKISSWQWLPKASYRSFYLEKISAWRYQGLNLGLCKKVCHWATPHPSLPNRRGKYSCFLKSTAIFKSTVLAFKIVIIFPNFADR